MARAMTEAGTRIARDVQSTTGRVLTVGVDELDQDWVQVSVELDGDQLGSWGHAGFADGLVEMVTVQLADGLRENYLDEEIWGGWPICPDHEHPLDPALDSSGVASWRCPRGRVVAPIGGLEAPEGCSS
jgi:hypothetical protein